MPEGLSRRSFIKLATAASAAAAIPGCEPAARKLIPYVVPDENVTPGMPTFYATTCAECPAGCGVIATVREGRVTTLGGNPADPVGAGAICARGQAALQGLYNPDRLAEPMLRGDGGALNKISWDEASKLLTDRLGAAAKAGRNRVAFVGAPQGPTFEKIARAFVAAYGSNQAIFYEALATESARSAAQTLFGRRDLPVYKIDAAETLISFGADFLETGPSPVELTRQYAEFRAPKTRRGQLTIGRSFYVGPRMSMTAAKCDDWIAAAPGAEAQIAWSVLHVLVAQRWIAQNSGLDLNALTTMVAAYEPTAVSQRTGVPADKINAMGAAFGKADGAVAIASGDDDALHLAAYMLNAATGNLGRTMLFLDGAGVEPVTSASDVSAAMAAMRDGKIDVAVINGANPIFTMPPSMRAAESLQRVGFVVWMGTVPDETANMASLLLPAHHPLEAWRDTAPRPGVRGLGQPVMQPVFESRAAGDIMLAAAAKAQSNLPWPTTAAAVKAEWLALAAQGGGSDAQVEFWTTVRREGGLYAQAKPAAVKLSMASLKTPSPGDAGSSEITFVAYPHIFLYDGRGADKPWLQEIPEPVTQIVWDSWAEIHPTTAAKLGIAKDELIELRTEHGVIEAPALISTNVHPGAIVAPLGQGHRAYGRYAKDVGANPWKILAAGSMRIAVTAKGTGKTRTLISPLGKSDMLGRSIVEAMSLDELRHGGEPEAPPAPGPYEMYPPFPYPNHKWGMTIDVNACTGCSACVAACYAENNLPFVGKDGVDNGRIMSWIRIERYFPEDKEHAPNLYLAPMLCQQCNHAPCEPVCPVFASYHTQEGLNGQVYNRCVGTRYCENNCPYKVRRFNWFVPEWPAPLNLQLNPDVTVRGAGVMEKCTFCIQRIQHAEIDARNDGRAVRDGEIVPACAGACPARAITFGDMNDKQSAMMRRRDENKPRNYRSLEELNTQPAIVYLRDLYREKGKA
ncbi:MAG TPA: molybdopterin-dependent oxidoreductase [Candidatus Binataceae bacterium]|nr:molybdopterin-dependent oxidoreductase [Candidatus Binataceae bacterium]